MSLTPEQARIVAELLDEGANYRKFNKLAFYEPYLKQLEFHNAGKDFNERGLIAANQVGKTYAGGFEDAVHLTGLYPDWWEGWRATHPVQMWVCGPNGEKVRDTTQEMLYGPWQKPDEFGTGYLPRDSIVGRPTLSRGVAGYYDTGVVKWRDKNGRLDESALSTVTFKAYTEGQLAFASNTIDVAHEDEEPGNDIHSEIKTRLQVKKGICYLTLTPLLGWTEMMVRMLVNPEKVAGIYAVSMGIFDACIGHDPTRPYLGHYSRQQADEIIAGYDPHIRNARAFGEPALGEGKVFMADENLYKIPRSAVIIQPHFAKLGALDFGGAGMGSHPFAWVLIAIDRDNDIIYLVNTLKLQGMTIPQHVPRIRAIAPSVMNVWPHDGNELDRGGSGKTIAQQYRDPMPGMPGLQMYLTHATWPDGGFSTEAAIHELDERMQTGRFYAFDDLTEFFAEARQYHREKGKIVPINDDILSALFKAIMMQRVARPGLLGNEKVGKYSRRMEWNDGRSGTVAPVDLFTNRPLTF